MKTLHVLPAAVALVLATPVVTWWVVGDLSEPIEPASASYTVRPPQLAAGVEAGLGTAAAIVRWGSFLILLVGTKRRLVDRRWWGAVLPLVVVGAFCALAYRIMTAAVRGANIGAGMVILVGPGLILPALTVSAWNVVAIARSSRRARLRSPG